ncbi:MAG TPA: GNAT family N-acetyltransferase [Ilumatobacteraceae bacterium]|nr:GNAT family N-acetyltransferase [Ilumatobacteraceae bacterium]
MYEFVVVDPESDAAVAAMTAYFDELDDRFPSGFDPGDTLVTDAPTMRPPGGTFVIATDGADGTIAACGGVLTIGDGIGEIKRMWVAPGSRGRGLGRLLLTELEARSRALGHHMVRLDTNSVLAEAIEMYDSAGYRPIERYNDNPFAQRWFEKRHT